MTKIEYTSPKFYLLVDCPEEPIYTEGVNHNKYHWQVNRFERKKKEYNEALKSCERILIDNPEILKVFYPIMNPELEGDNMIDLPDEVQYELSYQYGLINEWINCSKEDYGYHSRIGHDVNQFAILKLKAQPCPKS